MPKSSVEIQGLAKSCNEALILAVLREGPKHGYQLALDIEQRGGGRFRFHHGTLYPILHKLEKEGLIRGTWTDEGPRRKRKSYALTAKGRRYAREQIREWRAFIASFLQVIGEDEA